MKNENLINYLTEKQMMLDQCDPRTRIWVRYTGTNNVVCEETWTLRALWEKILNDEVSIILFKVLR